MLALALCASCSGPRRPRDAATSTEDTAPFVHLVTYQGTGESRRRISDATLAPPEGSGRGAAIAAGASGWSCRAWRSGTLHVDCDYRSGAFSQEIDCEGVTEEWRRDVDLLSTEANQADIDLMRRDVEGYRAEVLSYALVVGCCRL